MKQEDFKNNRKHVPDFTDLKVMVMIKPAIKKKEALNESKI